MRRLRLLRLLVLLSAVVVGAVVAFYLLRGAEPAAVARTPRRPGAATTAERIEFTDLMGGDRRGGIVARSVERRADGRVRLEGIERLEIDREGRSPLVLSADSGEVVGAPGSRTMHVSGGIRLQDDASGLSMQVESLDWDEKAGEVRSGSGVTLASPEMQGKAASVVYGLREQPSVLQRPELRTNVGQTLTAARAILRDGTRDVELEADVRVSGDEGRLEAGRLRLFRRSSTSGQRATASEGVRGESSAVTGAPRTFRSSEADLEWNESGAVERIQLRGAASLSQGPATLQAEWIEATRPPDAPTQWDVQARGDVQASGRRADGAWRARSRELSARLDAGGGLPRAQAIGAVRAQGPSGSVEGDRVDVWTEGGRRRALVHAGPGARKASLSTGRARVAGDRITLDEGAGSTIAEGRVEATLLPNPSRAKGAAGPFRADQPVHFVAERLDATQDGDHLLFTGRVRGWQGSRSLSGSRVEMDRSDDVLSARGSVVTRLPRRPGAEVSEADYVQVAAETLDYRGRAGSATYAGGVRMRQAEGWLESERLDAALSKDGGVERVDATGTVRFEFRSARRGDPQLATGHGDRAQYLPRESLVRLFGDRAPATVQKAAPNPGTTEGRVLRYRLDSGALEVESGARNRGRIETSGS